MNAELITSEPNETKACHYEVDIKIPAGEIKSVITDVEKRFRSLADIPGFRKGKAPLPMVRKKFNSKILEEVEQQVVRESLSAVLEKSDFEPVTFPSFVEERKGELSADADFSFAIEFDVKPKFDLPEYKGMKLTREARSVSDEDVTKTIDEFRQRRATYDKIERAAEEGDMLKVSYSSELEGGEDVSEEAKRLLEAKETWLILSEAEIIPGTRDGLKGVNAGDEKKLDVEFPGDFKEESLAGKTAAYTFSIEEVWGSLAPELDDEFAKSCGAEGVDDLKEKVRESLEQEIEQAQNREMATQVHDQLIAQDSFELPPTVYDYELEMAILSEKHRQESAAHHAEECNDPDHHHDHDEPKSDDDIRKEAEETVGKRLKFEYQVDALAKEFDLTVEQAEVKQRFDYFKMSMGMDDAQVAQKYDVQAIQTNIRKELLSEKVVRQIIDQAEIEDVEPKPETESKDD